MNGSYTTVVPNSEKRTKPRLEVSIVYHVLSLYMIEVVTSLYFSFQFAGGSKEDEDKVTTSHSSITPQAVQVH